MVVATFRMSKLVMDCSNVVARSQEVHCERVLQRVGDTGGLGPRA